MNTSLIISMLLTVGFKGIICKNFPNKKPFFHVFCCVLDVFVYQEEEMKRKKREERLEMIRNNVQLKYALKRKVSDLAWQHFKDRRFQV